MLPLSWRSWRASPIRADGEAAGYHQLFGALEAALGHITACPGLAAAQLRRAGELAGLLVHPGVASATAAPQARHRDIPQSAHGPTGFGGDGGLQVVSWPARQGQHRPSSTSSGRRGARRSTGGAARHVVRSTHGVFAGRHQDILPPRAHARRQVYMDGANLNDQVGVTSPAAIGADVCHINLQRRSHPACGGGPGMGPICVAAHLARTCRAPVVKTGGAKAIHAVSAAPWGVPRLAISYGYIAMLGRDGLREAPRSPSSTRTT